jgi:2-polyprenyl-3-methyl-5-hydroxy-6-metoxy-1,4-benzoquinol methylase
MATTITYTSCPACGNASISKALVCRDYTVSHQEFEVWECSNCSLRFTQYVPTADAIGPYYQSENYISHSDTGKGLVNKLYKLARRYTLSAKRRLVVKTTGLTKGRLLDIGCGTGAFINEMKQANWQVTGLEPDAGARQKAKDLYSLEPLAAQEIFNLKPGSYNAITMWHVLEHVHELHAYMNQFTQLLAGRGKLFIAVPNYTSADAVYYGPYWAAYDVPRHLYHFSPAAMEKLAAKHGFTITAIKPMLLDAFYIAMLSEQYKNGKGNLIKAMWQGIRCLFATLGNAKKSSSLIYVLER